MRARALRVALLSALLSMGLGWARTPAQELPLRVTPSVTAPLNVPFGPGERLEYDVRLGALGKRGEGHMEVVGLDSVRGRTAYHVTMAIRGGVIWTQVDDRYQSWFDITNMATLRSIQDIDELTYERYRHFEIFPDERRFERRDKVEGGTIPTSEPLDDLTFFYFVRTLDLEVGKEYSFSRYYRENGNPVILRILRRDTVQVPAGTFNTIVVQPIIRTSGLFGDGGKAELHFSDDERRIMVLMRSEVPLVGSLSLHLRSIREGRPIIPPGSGEGGGAG